MNTPTDEMKRGPGRPRKPREEETQRRRKSREGVTAERMGVNKSMLDVNNYAYRWINDRPARIHALTKEDDWNIVHQDGSEIKDDSDVGSAVNTVVGTHPDGSPLRAYLCRKRIEWYAADQDEKMAELEEQLGELRRGNTRTGQSQAEYVPNSGIRI